MYYLFKANDVLVIFEYTSPTWAPWTQGDINVLEKVQERMVNMIPSLSGKSYEEKLAEIFIMSLVNLLISSNVKNRTCII